MHNKMCQNKQILDDSIIKNLENFINNKDLTDLINYRKSMSLANTDNKKAITQSNTDLKNKMKEYEDSNKHDFISLILGVFGDSNFNTKFVLFFISMYIDIINGHKLDIVDENQSLEQVLENISNKIDNKNNKISENSTSSVSDEVVASDISNNKKKLTIHQKKNAFLKRLNDKEFLICSFKYWLDGGYSDFEEKEKDVQSFKKFIFHYNQYNWIEEEQVYHITNQIRYKIKEAVLFLYPYYDHKYGDKYLFNIFRSYHLFSYDIYHSGDLKDNHFIYKNLHGYTINEIIDYYQKSDMLPSLLNTFHSIQVKQENNATQYQIKNIVHVDETSNYIISPHLVYCEIKNIVFYLHFHHITDEQIHQLYDDFCGMQLVDDMLQEAKKYSSGLNQHGIDYFAFDKNLLMFQLDLRKTFLTKDNVDDILKNHEKHKEENIYLGYINVNKLNDIFGKIESTDLRRTSFNLLGLILKNNDFTILKPYYCFKIKYDPFVIKPFSQYQENELDDLKYNNPICFYFNWMNLNHPNTMLKSYVHQYILLKELSESNLPYYKIWKTMVEANQYCNFYQVGKPVYFGIEHLKNKTHDQFNDFIQYFLRCKENNVSIYEYSDINIPMFNKFLNANSSTIKDNNDIVKNIFYPRNLMFLDKKTSNLNMDTMLNFKEVHEHLLSEIQRYHKDNSYYIKPIFLKIQQHGLGVTHFLQEFSKDMLLGLENVDVSTLSTYSSLIGLSNMWSNGTTGLIYNLSQQHKSKLALLCLDNFDKLGGRVHKGDNSLEKYPIDVVKKIILKESRLNYVDDYDVTKFVNINHLITICVGEHIPDIYSNDIVNSFNVFNITPYKMDNPMQPNPIFANIWKEIMQE